LEEELHKLYVESLVCILALCDLETEEHARCVTALVLELARAYGVPKNELIHIQYGALLHDLGKIGIPDHILLKKGELTMQERAIIKMHPVYAYEILSPIPYLHQALEVPYCHHEKWDGTGYPRGLKGNQIPFSARLFAVVDVWDALLSDRPYRSAWSIEQASEYILEQSGKYFDPEIATVFLENITVMVRS